MKKDNPLIDVVMPTFNSEKYISGTIDSIIKQDYKNWRLLISDGGSTDKTLKIIDKYVSCNKNIIKVFSGPDRGPADARRRCIQYDKKSDYIAFCDADDIWHKNKLKKQISFMVKKGINFCYTDYEIISDDGTKKLGTVNPCNSYSYFQYLRKRGIVNSSVLIKKSLLDMDVIKRVGRCHGEDLLWWLLILRKGEVAKKCVGILVKYRIARGSLSTNIFSHLRSIFEIYFLELKDNRFLKLIYFFLYLINVIVRIAYSRIQQKVS